MSDTKKHTKCSAHMENGCKNGFPVTSVCLGVPAGIPMCCKVEWCGRAFNSVGGKPLVKNIQIAEAKP